MSDDLTRKAIVTFNGSYADGLTKALQAVVEMVLEEAAKLAADKADNDPMDDFDNGWTAACADIAAAIRALKEKV